MRRRISELTGQDPMGSQHLPYDQTDPSQQVGPLAVAGGPTGAALPQPSMPQSALPPGAPDQGATPPDPGGMLGAVGGGMAQAPAGPNPAMGGSTDQMTGDQLAQLSAPVQLQSPEEQQIAQMDAALNDPNTPPDQVAQIQQMLDLAARRRLAGIGGSGQGGGLGV